MPKRTHSSAAACFAAALLYMKYIHIQDLVYTIIIT